MPNVVLFNKELTSTDKLMFCYISSLCAGSGSCRPRNKHLAEKFDLKQRQVTNILQNLAGYIYAYEDSRGRRMLAITPDLTEDKGGSNVLLGGTQSIATHSNINSNNKKYTSEMLTNIEKVYDIWLKLMVVDPTVRAHGTTDERRAALLAASKRTRLTDKRKAKAATRIESMGLDRVLAAIKQISKSEFHRDGMQSDGTIGTFTASLEWLCENDERIETWANKGGNQ
jgi:hypothetical protein